MATQSIPIVSCLSSKNASFTFVPQPSVPDTNVRLLHILKALHGERTGKSAKSAKHLRAHGSLYILFHQVLQTCILPRYPHRNSCNPSYFPPICLSVVYPTQHGRLFAKSSVPVPSNSDIPLPAVWHPSPAPALLILWNILLIFAKLHHLMLPVSLLQVILHLHRR